MTKFLRLKTLNWRDIRYFSVNSTMKKQNFKIVFFVKSKWARNGKYTYAEKTRISCVIFINCPKISSILKKDWHFLTRSQNRKSKVSSENSSWENSSYLQKISVATSAGIFQKTYINACVAKRYFADFALFSFKFNMNKQFAQIVLIKA